jgi:hypothetical protein
MESTDARRMFPCWDKPAFRATVQLRVTAPAAWESVSNMPVTRRVVHGELATTTFERSPKMPSYLVEYTAGELAQINAVADKTGSQYGPCAARSMAGRRLLATRNRSSPTTTTILGIVIRRRNCCLVSANLAVHGHIKDGRTPSRFCALMDRGRFMGQSQGAEMAA